VSDPRILYTAELAEEFCKRMAEGRSLRSVCADADMPCTETVRKWKLTLPEFAAQYARARESRAEFLADEIIDIADAAEDAQKARLQVDARKWFASKLAPKTYGDKVELEHSGEVKYERIIRTIVDPANPDA